jgi:hypothetical protein
VEGTVCLSWGAHRRRWSMVKIARSPTGASLASASSPIARSPTGGSLADGAATTLLTASLDVTGNVWHVC